jgi:hypothetical protein
MPHVKPRHWRNSVSSRDSADSISPAAVLPYTSCGGGCWQRRGVGGGGEPGSGAHRSEPLGRPTKRRGANAGSRARLRPPRPGSEATPAPAPRAPAPASRGRGRTFRTAPCPACPPAARRARTQTRPRRCRCGGGREAGRCASARPPRAPASPKRSAPPPAVGAAAHEHSNPAKTRSTPTKARSNPSPSPRRDSPAPVVRRHLAAARERERRPPAREVRDQRAHQLLAGPQRAGLEDGGQRQGQVKVLRAACIARVGGAGWGERVRGEGLEAEWRARGMQRPGSGGGASKRRRRRSLTPGTQRAPGRHGLQALNSSWLNSAAVKKASFFVRSTPDTTWSWRGEERAGRRRRRGFKRWRGPWVGRVTPGAERGAFSCTDCVQDCPRLPPDCPGPPTAPHLDEPADGLAVSGHDVLLVGVDNAVALGAPVLVLFLVWGVGWGRVVRWGAGRGARWQRAGGAVCRAWGLPRYIDGPPAAQSFNPRPTWGRCRLISSPSKSALNVEQLE